MVAKRAQWRKDKEVTSKRAEAAAAKVLRDPKNSKRARMAAGLALTMNDKSKKR